MLSVDGLWIDMNEPSNFCNGECKGPLETAKVFISNSTYLKPQSAKAQQNLVDPPYYIDNQNSKAPLNTKTLDPDAIQYGTTHYNAHNLFGTSCVCSFFFFFDNHSASGEIANLVFAIARSTFCSTGQWMYKII